MSLESEARQTSREMTGLCDVEIPPNDPLVAELVLIKQRLDEGDQTLINRLEEIENTITHQQKAFTKAVVKSLQGAAKQRNNLLTMVLVVNIAGIVMLLLLIWLELRQ